MIERHEDKLPERPLASTLLASARFVRHSHLSEALFVEPIEARLDACVRAVSPDPRG